MYFNCAEWYFGQNADEPDNDKGAVNYADDDYDLF